MSNELEKKEEKIRIALMQKHLGLLEPWNINVNIEYLSSLKELAVQVLLRSIKGLLYCKGYLITKKLHVAHVPARYIRTNIKHLQYCRSMNIVVGQ